MSKRLNAMLTVGEIARRTEQPIHRVEYVIRARRIEPEGWAGNLRVFSEVTLERIARELAPVENTVVTAPAADIGGRARA